MESDRVVGDRALGREYFPDDQVGDLFYKGLINNKKQLI